MVGTVRSIGAFGVGVARGPTPRPELVRATLDRPKLLPLTPRSEMPTRADLSSVAFRRWLKDSGMKFGLLHEEAA